MYNKNQTQKYEMIAFDASITANFNENIFTRVCPCCSRKITHHNWISWWRAYKNNLICKSCSKVQTWGRKMELVKG